MTVREYGVSGPAVVVLHGGPGAPGHMAPVARGLADAFRVWEPWQRRAGGEPLTVARHVADLRELITGRIAPERPALVGSSWGAMLALAYAAEHPDAGPLVLIGCGTFDPAARARMHALIAERRSPEIERQLAALERDLADPDQRLAAMGALIDPLYNVDPLPDEPDDGVSDGRGHQETWQDMLRRQAAGDYPAAFAAIRAPVLMLHGSYDPHPGPMIRDSLRLYLPDLEYVEWDDCGHYPWRERAVREEFFAVLRQWLASRLA